MSRPVLLAQESPETHEVACLLSVCPTFIPPEPQEEFELVINERPEEQEALEIKNDKSFAIKPEEIKKPSKVEEVKRPIKKPVEKVIHGQKGRP